MKKEKNEEEKKVFGIFEAFSEIMNELFVMESSAEGEKTHVTSVEIRDMLREVLDISVNQITQIMLEKGFKVSMIGGTACWLLVRR